MGRNKTDKSYDPDYIWMKVSIDKYELPEMVAESREELAEILGVKPKSISEDMSRAKRKGMKCSYIKVSRKEGNENDRSM